MWRMLVDAQKEKEFKDIAAVAATVIQNAYRGMAGRKWLMSVRIAKYKKQLDEAARIIQNLARRKAGFNVFVAVKRARSMEAAAKAMQSVFRGRKSRMFFAAMRQREREKKAVRIMLKLIRGKLGRNRFAEAVENKRLSGAASILQRRQRGRRARQQFVLRLERDKRKKAARLLQSRIRIRMSKKYAKQRAEDLVKERAQLHHAAMLLQGAYRGHQGRCSVLLKFQAHFKVQKEQNMGATTIQKIARAIQTRTEVNEMKRVKFDELKAWAQMTSEHWDDEYQAYYYVNADTGESQNLPPRTGFVCTDGIRFVLSSGKVTYKDGSLASTVLPTDVSAQVTSVSLAQDYKDDYSSPEAYQAEWDIYQAAEEEKAADAEFGYVDEATGEYIWYEDENNEEGYWDEATGDWIYDDAAAGEEENASWEENAYWGEDAYASDYDYAEGQTTLLSPSFYAASPS
jgi:hypothetical protein